MSKGSRRSSAGAEGKGSKGSPADAPAPEKLPPAPAVEVKHVRLDRKAEPTSPGSQTVLKTLGRRPSHSLQVIIENHRCIHECYDLHSMVIGKGSFGSVKKASLKATRAVRAVKVISKNTAAEKVAGKTLSLKREIQIMKRLDHPNVLRLHELFEDDDNIYIILELCSGGDLLGCIKRAGGMTEGSACKVMAQILRAVVYLHGIRICHRDLKPENCLLTTFDSPLSRMGFLRVADFGLSCPFAPGQLLKNRVGTTAFMAPQVMAKEYTEACDLWSCGVIAYMLLCGYLPFLGRTEAETRLKVQEGQLVFVASDWAHVSERAIDMVCRLLTREPQTRCDAQKALAHEWVREAVAGEAQAVRVEAKIVQNLRGFRSLNRFKRAALQVIASLLGEEQVRASRDAFLALDADCDGYVSLADLCSRFATPGLAEAAKDGDWSAHELLKFLHGEKGTWKPCSYTEFLAATFDRRSNCSRRVCLAAFNVFDTNRNGTISKQELRRGAILGSLSAADLAQLFRDLDQNRDGEIDFEEFVDMMRDGEGWRDALFGDTKGLKAPRSRPALVPAPEVSGLLDAGGDGRARPGAKRKGRPHAIRPFKP